MKTPTFSIIIPTHNGADRIRKAILSVLRQSCKDYELLVVCDGCMDNSAEIARDYGAKVFTTRFCRDGMARNAGLDNANGEWILFIDDDDWLVHDYCLETLKETAVTTDADTIDYSFIWQGKGYKRQTERNRYTMVWCRAWRRSFIGKNRFSDHAYGSDTQFFRKMIQENPDIKTVFMDKLIYCYNYMREGSLSWMEKNKIYLDIIVTHKDEPWELGKPLFDMIQMQIRADGHFKVTVIQDGEDGKLDWNDLFQEYDYQISTFVSEENVPGPASARNFGLEHTHGDWVMFMDFDDMLADVCSLKMLLEVLPTDSCDLIWTPYIREQKWGNGSIYLNKIDSENFTSTDGKMYRRAFLTDHELRFPIEATGSDYQYVFNSLCLEETTADRVLKLNCDVAYPFVKIFREDSWTKAYEFDRDCNINIILRDLLLCRDHARRGHEVAYKRSCMQLFCDQYYTLHCPDESRKITTVTDDEFWKVSKGYYETALSVSPTDVEVVLDQAMEERMNSIQGLYHGRMLECYFVNDGVEFVDWIRKFADMDGAVSGDEPEEPPVREQPVAKDPRVVVYCGTRNVYDSMETSLKSLLCHTKVDKVFFLIEDDQFPTELPDIVECVNVSDQTVFSPDGPNYQNTWSYMCMMRAIYPEMFKGYNKVLSLDIDIIVRTDISELWDIDLEGYYLAGVEEPQRKKNPDDNLYINFGVVMMNLEEMREDGIQELVVRELNTNKCPCPEQDAYNRICGGRILKLDNGYNVTAYSHITGDAEEEKITHYAGMKFWKHFGVVREYSGMSWKDVMQKVNDQE